MNVLIVDDNRLSLDAMKQVIESLGHKVFRAETGEDAIQQISGNKIDFVFSDIMMPGISGLSLVSLLRNILMFQGPVILFSSMDTDRIKDSSYGIGANGFISKPVSIAEIALALNTHIHSHN